MYRHRCYLIFTCLFLVFKAYGQLDTLFPRNFLGEYEYEFSEENKISSLADINLSGLWMKTENQFIYGVIGNEHQRIQVKLIRVEKNASNPLMYQMSGKTMVHGNVCDFDGLIVIEKVFEVKRVDDEYANKGIMRQGVLIGRYDFRENKKQPHTGTFNGHVFTKWFITRDGNVHYDNMDSVADGYMNNAFVGTWKRYNVDDERICNWGDYRVPNANLDFDIGAGDFSPSSKYLPFGWENYEKEILEWWK